MTEYNARINQLFEKLTSLLEKQDHFSREINLLRNEINVLKASQPINPFEEKKEIKVAEPATESISQLGKDLVVPFDQTQQTKYSKKSEYAPSRPNIQPKVKSDIEKFIGENLINKIGIAITVFGVAIGAKYSVEHQLISPLTRIILGYLMGLGLLGFGIKLKKDYLNYSAVLVSGAIAILYFITFFAYSFYDLIPQVLAFALMVVFTTFTVIAAINYNKQIIAHIGLVGAYAVPFLLSEGSGKVWILFSYMAIINIGILFIAFKRYWKPLYYSSFVLTWLIFYLWFTSKYQSAEHYEISLVFLSVFFATFYTVFLAYKLIKKEKYETEDIVLLLANSFLFYGLGYAILSTHKTGVQLLGLFTLCNAFIHFIISSVIYRQKLADRNLFFLVAGLVLVFITITFPVQLDGNWVTLLWAFEAALLFWIGRTKNVIVYEKLSYILMFLAFFSITQDWLTLYDSYNPELPITRLSPLININFLSSILFIASFTFINYLNKNEKYPLALSYKNGLGSFINFSIPAILIIVLYYAFQMEISTYWNQLFIDSEIEIKVKGQEYPNTYWNYDLNRFKSIWIINYSLLFLSILAFVNIKKLKNRNLGLITTAFNTFVLIVFLIYGLYSLSELRESYLKSTLSEYYNRTSFNIGIRYISFSFVALMLISFYKQVNQEFIKPVFENLKIVYDFLLHTTILWVASSELITWMDIMTLSQSYKLGLSILWGFYALLLIILGIARKKKHLRIGAMGLFAATLLKLFFYDISHLDTIAKTVVLVSLGIILLLISFLYNKYKNLISPENDN